MAIFSFNIINVKAETVDYLSESDFTIDSTSVVIQYTIPANSGDFTFEINLDSAWWSAWGASTDDFWLYINSASGDYSAEFEGTPSDAVNGSNGFEEIFSAQFDANYDLSIAIPNSTQTTTIFMMLADGNQTFLPATYTKLDEVFSLMGTVHIDEIDPEFTYSNLAVNTPYYDLVNAAEIQAQLHATDDEDGDVSSRIEIYQDNYTLLSKIVGGDFFIMFRVSDLSGNYAYLRVDVEIYDDLAPHAFYNSVTYEDLDSLPGFTWYNDSPASVKLTLEEIQALFVFEDENDSEEDLLINVTSNYAGEDEYYDAVGSHTVYVSVEDLSGNRATITVPITVLANSAPVITGASTKTVEITTLNINSILATYSASDAEDGTVAVTIDPANTWNYGSPVLGNFTLLLRTTDSLGRYTTKSVAVTVVDTTIPVIKIGGIASTSYAVTVNMSDTSTLQALINTITAIDAYYGNLTSSLVIPAFPSFATPGTTNMNITCTDASGNVGTLVLAVTVADDILPIINGPIKIVKGKTASLTLSEITAQLSSVDNISGTLSVVVVTDGYTGNAQVVGSYLVRYKATDTAGNIGYHNVRVWVVDNVAPVWVVDDYFINLGLNESMTRTQLVALLQASGMLANDVSYTVTFLTDEYTGSEEVTGVYSVIMRVTYEDGSEDEISVQLSVPENIEDGDIIVVTPVDELTGFQSAILWIKTAAANTWNFVKSVGLSIAGAGVWTYDHILKPVWDFFFVKDATVTPDPIVTTTAAFINFQSFNIRY